MSPIKVDAKTMLNVLRHIQSQKGSAGIRFQIVDTHTSTKHCGICGLLIDIQSKFSFRNDNHDSMYIIMKEYMYYWPKASGSAVYPVPADDFPTSATAFSHYAANHLDMWDANTTYGALRWELFDYCVNRFEEEYCVTESN